MKHIHKTHYYASLFISVVLLAMAAWANPAYAESGDKVTGHYIRQISSEVAWEVMFSAHDAVQNKKGKTRPAKGFAMGTRIAVGEPMFWVMAVTCTEVFDENYARFAGIITDHSDPENIGKPLAFEAYDYAQPGNGLDYLRRKPSGDFTGDDCPAYPGECTAFEYAEAFCDEISDPPPGVLGWLVTEGNIRIHF